MNPVLRTVYEYNDGLNVTIGTYTYELLHVMRQQNYNACIDCNDYIRISFAYFHRKLHREVEVWLVQIKHGKVLVE